MYKKYLPRICLILLFVMLFIVSCSKPGIVVEYSDATSFSPQPSNTGEVTSPNPSLNNTKEPIISSLPNLFGKEPFDELGFAINPSDANSIYIGKIYSPLPDHTQIRVMVGWIDKLGAIQEKSDFFLVNNQQINYTFTIDQIIQPQYVYLGAMLDMTDNEHPQPDSIKSILGASGEFLPSNAVKRKEDGSMGLMNAWAIPFPSEDIADKSIQDSILQKYSDIFIDSQWVDGEYIAKFSSHDLNSIQKEELITILQSAAKLYRPHESGLKPRVKAVDINSNVLLEAGYHYVEDYPMTEVYIVSKGSGAKYHESTCRYAKGAEKIPEFLAKMKNHEPCKICH